MYSLGPRINTACDHQAAGEEYYGGVWLWHQGPLHLDEVIKCSCRVVWFVIGPKRAPVARCGLSTGLDRLTQLKRNTLKRRLGAKHLIGSTGRSDSLRDS